LPSAARALLAKSSAENLEFETDPAIRKPGLAEEQKKRREIGQAVLFRNNFGKEKALAQSGTAS